MRVALLQLGANQKSRSANLQSLMAAIDRAATDDDELDILVMPVIGDTHAKKAGLRGLFASVSETIAWKAREWGVYIATGMNVKENQDIRLRSFLFDPDGDVVARTGGVASSESGSDQKSVCWFSSPVGRIGVVDPQTAEAVIHSTHGCREEGFVAYPVPSPKTAAERRLVASTLHSLRSNADVTLGSYWGMAGRAEEGAVAGNAGNAVTFLRDASGAVRQHASLSCETVLHVEIDLTSVRGEAGKGIRSSDDYSD